jgi:cyanate permease
LASPREVALPNFIWPHLKRRNVGAAGEFSRVLHWMGVIAAGMCLLLAAEFAVEGWATHLSRSLILLALALVFGTRGLRYVLARE